MSPSFTASPSPTTIWNTVDTISARTSSAICAPLRSCTGRSGGFTANHTWNNVRRLRRETYRWESAGARSAAGRRTPPTTASVRTAESARHANGPQALRRRAVSLCWVSRPWHPTARRPTPRRHPVRRICVTSRCRNASGAFSPPHLRLMSSLICSSMPYARRHVPQCVEVMLQPLAADGIAFVVQHHPHVGDHRRTVEFVVVGRAHRETSCCSASSAVPRLNPRSRATSASSPRNCLRPRCSRDITVPIGVPMISAISLYGKPSTSA